MRIISVIFNYLKEFGASEEIINAFLFALIITMGIVMFLRFINMNKEE